MHARTHTHTHTHTHNGILFNHQKNEIVPFAMTWMELEYIMLSEISQSEKDKYHMISLMWNLRNKTSEQRGKRESDKPRKRLLTIENKLMVTRGGGWAKWVMGIKEGTCCGEH